MEVAPPDTLSMVVVDSSIPSWSGGVSGSVGGGTKVDGCGVLVEVELELTDDVAIGQLVVTEIKSRLVVKLVEISILTVLLR